MARELPEVSAGSMADIAFTLLIFFLVSTTLASDKGKKMILPKWVDNPEQLDNIIDVNERNVFAVDIQPDGSLNVEGAPFEYSRLTQETEAFMTNNRRNPLYSDSWEMAIVNLRIHPDAPYESYLEAYSNIEKAFMNVRNNFALREHGIAYDKLDDFTLQEVKNKYPLKLAEKIDDFEEKED